MRLKAAITQGSGTVNEDGYGVLGRSGSVEAAWVFDGVTGINGRNYLPAASDAAWIVEQAHSHLLALAGGEAALPDILEQLVARLIADWAEVTRGIALPENYDPPAACLILVKRYADGWKALRLGDSCLLSREAEGDHQVHAASPNNAFDHWLSQEARKRRDAGVLDIKALLAEFRPQLQAGRAKRNRSDGYSILECSEAALKMPEYLALGTPADILLCTDGYYRAVDHYALYDDAGLIRASAADAGAVLKEIRAVEYFDADCQKFLRFKPADDATAVALA